MTSYEKFKYSFIFLLGCNILIASMQMVHKNQSHKELSTLAQLPVPNDPAVQQERQLEMQVLRNNEASSSIILSFSIPLCALWIIGIIISGYLDRRILEKKEDPEELIDQLGR